jgi:hypothetical protein
MAGELERASPFSSLLPVKEKRMSNLPSRPDFHLFERLHRTTVFLADALRPCWERADRMLHAWGDAMRATIRRATLFVRGR